MDEQPDQAYEWTTRRIVVAALVIATIALSATAIAYHYFAGQRYVGADAAEAHGVLSPK